MGSGLQVYAFPGGSSGAYQYNSSGSFAGGELRRVDATITDLGATPPTGAFGIAVGTTGQRPGSPVAGYIRFNTSLSQWEGWDGSAWGSLAGSAGTPGGSSGDYQYNNAGAFGGATLKQISTTVAALGAASATPAAQTFRGQAGTGTDIAGGSLTVASGPGTGAGAASSLVFQTPTVLGSGTTGQTLTTRLTVATTSITATVPYLAPNGTAAAPAYSFTGAATDGLYYSSASAPAIAAGGVAVASFTTANLSLQAALSLGWASGDPTSTSIDAMLSRKAAATIHLGAADAASPVAQTFGAQGARGGTDNNVAGASLTVRSGIGTGSAAASSIAFQTPTVGGSGTTAQTMATRLTVSTTAVTVANGAVFTGDGSGLTTLNASNLASGTVPSARLAGKVWVGRTVLTASSGTYTTGATASVIVVQLWAGGGGGGGADSASNASMSGGGGAGGYAMKTFSVSASTGYSYACGAAGTGGSAGNNNGNNGGDSTFTVGGTTVTAKGGSGGTSMASGTAVAFVAGGAGGTVSTNGDINGAGAPGGAGQRANVGSGQSGFGGSTALGGGGLGLVSTTAAGNAGIGPGAGGGGGCGVSSGGARAGGDGVAGVIIVDEYA